MDREMSNEKIISKIAMVTGGSRGIGAEIAKELSKKGYKVAITYTSLPDKANEVIKCIEKHDGTAIAVKLDYANRKSIQEAIIETQSHFSGIISIIVNNGAIAQEKKFDTITDHDWQTMLTVNLQGPFSLTQELLPNMVKQQWGRIINITSIGGQWGGFNQVHYAASKAGLINFTQSISKIYSRDGITSNAIAIGLVATEMSKNELNTTEGKAKVANIPIGRLGDPLDIANMVKFLASDESEYITGQTLNLNGGMFFS
jgi:acetoacetyl-CoA reductase/3-oxoacyl-[acyl-carrier protein] reductase